MYKILPSQLEPLGSEEIWARATVANRARVEMNCMMIDGFCERVETSCNVKIQARRRI
jgi:hypothetical protein